MGIFDRFRSPTPVAPINARDVPPLLRRDSLHIFPETSGRFGWDESNPVPCGLLWTDNGAENYLAWLTWKGRPLEAERIGSVGARGLPGPVDIYSISQDQIPIGNIHLCPYASRNSCRLPTGFSASTKYILEFGIATTLAKFGKTNSKYLKRLGFSLFDVTGKERAKLLDVNWVHLANLVAYFDSTKDQHSGLAACCIRIWPDIFTTVELQAFAAIAEVPPDKLTHPAVP